MNSEAWIAIIGGLVVGSGIGFSLGRYAGGGWLFGCTLLIAVVALGLLSSPVLEAFGVPRDGFNHLGFAAVSILILAPAMAGMIIFGGIGLWRASRMRGRAE
ncbi:hypothetical protein [Nioella aestuarii]|uniref:hypothetical protein n=1 Tax=Nioella aestuarii TaxID=1662864 RepID=UPI003D7FF58A